MNPQSIHWCDETFIIWLFKAGAGSAEALEELRNDPNVEFIEPNYILRKADDNISSDKMSLDDIAFSVSNSSSFVQNRSNVHVTELL